MEWILQISCHIGDNGSQGGIIISKAAFTGWSGKSLHQKTGYADMRCPFCEALEDKVVESRMLANGESIRRRRECLKCGYRFTSYEHIEEKKLMVVKRNGGRQPFDVMKIEHGIMRALEKRPVTQNEIEEILLDIENEARMKARNTHEISSQELGKMVLMKLFKIDKVAYVRFASVYRHYENVEEFIREIENLS